MEIKIVFDKKAVNKKLHIGWGLSVLVDNKILFDTGEKGEWLLNNMKAMGVKLNNIEGIVISHDHWDHTGGLELLLKAKKKQTPVYICPDFSRELKGLIIHSGGIPVEVKKVQEIQKNIYTTGEIVGRYKGTFIAEQALVLNTEKGISIITGCAHPGILKIVSLVKKHFKVEKIYAVIGGFHLLEEDMRTIGFIVNEFKKMGVEKAGPTHCSGLETEEIFEKEYGENFISVKAGQTVLL